jgi:hypothetical protein
LQLLHDRRAPVREDSVTVHLGNIHISQRQRTSIGKIVPISYSIHSLTHTRETMRRIHSSKIPASYPPRPNIFTHPSKTCLSTTLQKALWFSTFILLNILILSIPITGFLISYYGDIFNLDKRCTAHTQAFSSKNSCESTC